jgi:hypothetical protein
MLAYIYMIGSLALMIAMMLFYKATKKKSAK